MQARQECLWVIFFSFHNSFSFIKHFLLPTSYIPVVVVKHLEMTIYTPFQKLPSNSVRSFWFHAPPVESRRHLTVLESWVVDSGDSSSRCVYQSIWQEGCHLCTDPQPINWTKKWELYSVWSVWFLVGGDVNMILWLLCMRMRACVCAGTSLLHTCEYALQNKAYVQVLVACPVKCELTSLPTQNCTNWHQWLSQGIPVVWHTGKVLPCGAVGPRFKSRQDQGIL